MSILEILIIAGICFIVVYCIYTVFFSKKKKSKNKETKTEKTKDKKRKDSNQSIKEEKKIEPAIKKSAKEEKVTEKEVPAPAEKVLQKDPPEVKGQPFKIIRKKSEVKINKQALKSGSRKPSVTKVFEKGTRIDLSEESNGGLSEDSRTEITKIEAEEKQANSKVMSDITMNKSEHYSIREYQYDAISVDKEFKINPPVGSPNRAPIINDRTNFASHLNVTEDNNLSGVVGTGVAKVIQETEKQTLNINKKTEEMITNVRRNVFGDPSAFTSFFDYGTTTEKKSKNTASQKLRKIDAETLIIADAIKKRKGK